MKNKHTPTGGGQNSTKPEAALRGDGCYLIERHTMTDELKAKKAERKMWSRRTKEMKTKKHCKYCEFPILETGCACGKNTPAKEPRKIGWLARIVRGLSAWAWTHEAECLMRAPFAAALANQQLDARTTNTHQLELREPLWMAILGTAEHCIDGSEFSPPNAESIHPKPIPNQQKEPDK